MRARDMNEEYPIVDLDADALSAAQLIVERRLPGIVVTDTKGIPQSVLSSWQVVEFIVPGYVQDDPQLAGVLNEMSADRLCARLSGKTVRSLLHRKAEELPCVDADDTIIEVAAMMARLRCPLVAVMEDGRLIGVVTASRLLEFALGLQQ